MVYLGGHVSAAHYNPAVTLAFWIRRAMPTRDVAPYVGVQVAAAVLAAYAAHLVTGDVVQVVPAEETGTGAFFLMELLFTFALVLVILNVATSRDLAGNDAYGIAIGAVVLGGSLAVGPISGAAFNPAVAVGPILVDVLVGEGLSVAGLWVYLGATFAGAALAAVVFGVQSPADARSGGE